MECEWDPNKAFENEHKHGVSFEEAATIFDDAALLTEPDFAHSDEEDRNLSYGLSEQGRVLVVAWTLRGDTIRLISARRATARERDTYGQG